VLFLVLLVFRLWVFCASQVDWEDRLRNYLYNVLSGTLNPTQLRNNSTSLVSEYLLACVYEDIPLQEAAEIGEQDWCQGAEVEEQRLEGVRGSHQECTECSSSCSQGISIVSRFALDHVSVFMFTLEKSSERLISCIVTDKCRVQEPCGGTAEAAPPPFRPGEPALCGSRPLVTPYYCRLGDFLCYIFISF